MLLQRLSRTILLCLSFQLLVASGIPRLVTSQSPFLLLSAHGLLYMSLCIFLLLVKTLVIGCGATLNPRMIASQDLLPIVSTKILFRNKDVFWDSWWAGIGVGELFNPLQRVNFIIIHWVNIIKEKRSQNREKNKWRIYLHIVIRQVSLNRWHLNFGTQMRWS